MARPAEKRVNPVIRRDNRIQRTIKEVIAELKKVIWPTRDEAVKLTTIVVAMIIAMSAFLGAIDYVLTQLTRFLLLR